MISELKIAGVPSMFIIFYDDEQIWLRNHCLFPSFSFFITFKWVGVGSILNLLLFPHWIPTRKDSSVDIVIQSFSVSQKRNEEVYNEEKKIFFLAVG